MIHSYWRVIDSDPRNGALKTSNRSGMVCGNVENIFHNKTAGIQKSRMISLIHFWETLVEILFSH